MTYTATASSSLASSSAGKLTLVTDSNGRAKRCKKLLQLLKEENSNLQKEVKVKPTDLRVRENLVNTLLRNLFIEMKRHKNSQHRYKPDVKKKVTRQDVDEIMRSDGGREALYINNKF